MGMDPPSAATQLLLLRSSIVVVVIVVLVVIDEPEAAAPGGSISEILTAVESALLTLLDMVAMVVPDGPGELAEAASKLPLSSSGDR